jgi:tRNA(fMet)-specific endonuclease VapC
MILLDTDTLTLLLQGHQRVQNRLRSAEPDVATTIISWMEIMRGRFDAVFKAADAAQLERAHQRLQDSARQLATLPIVPINAAAGQQFAKLLRIKKLKKIGRGDLLIASIALAQKAKLATRNLRDFRQIPGLEVENWAG